MDEPTMKVRMKPFVVPNFAVMEMPPRAKQDGVRELPSIPLSELPLETLDALAEQLRQGIYSKAGKALPEDRSDALSPSQPQKGEK